MIFFSFVTGHLRKGRLLKIIIIGGGASKEEEDSFGLYTDSSNAEYFLLIIFQK